MQFDEAVDGFCRFLNRQGVGEPIAWITPDDLFFWRGRILADIRAGSEARAAELFREGERRGTGAALVALLRLDHQAGCFVFVPDDREDGRTHFVAPPVTFKCLAPLRPASSAERRHVWLRPLSNTARSRRRVLEIFGCSLEDRVDPTRNV